MGFPLAAEDDDEFDVVYDCNLPGPAVNAVGGGSGIGDDEKLDKNGAGGKLGGLGIEFPGSGGGGGPKMST